jgi:ubiquitin fusion degradation protein 1
MPQIFEESYRCFSMAVGGKTELEGGDKIILPASALDSLTRMHVQYPMMFRAESSNKDAAGKRTHVGVSEFTAPEGRCYFPHWIMQNLLLVEGAFVHIRNVQLPKARFVKLQPHSKAFIEISNPRAV